MFDVLFVMVVVAFVSWGWSYGYSQAGITGGIVGACILGVAGYFVGKAPLVISIALMNRSLEKQTSDRLRERIHSGKESYIIHILLAHLIKRGENVDGELPVIVNLIQSEFTEHRIAGLKALYMAFPKVAANIDVYGTAISKEKCHALIGKIDPASCKENP